MKTVFFKVDDLKNLLGGQLVTAAQLNDARPKMTTSLTNGQSKVTIATTGGGAKVSIASSVQKHTSLVNKTKYQVTMVRQSSDGIPDAQIDGKPYVRQDGQWVELTLPAPAPPTFEQFSKNLFALPAELAYDLDGQLVEMIYGNGEIEVIKSLTYDPDGNLLSISLSGDVPEGMQTEKLFGYDAEGNLTSMEYR